MVAETLEPHLVETLRKSAVEVLETMVFLTPSSLDPIPEQVANVSAQVVGVLGFTGTKSGSFVVRTSEQLASTMAAKMLMMEPEELSGFEEVADAFGEIVNMLSGSFKNDWVADGNQMDLSVPQVTQSETGNLDSEENPGVSSGIRVQLEDQFVDFGIHFKG